MVNYKNISKILSIAFVLLSSLLCIVIITKAGYEGTPRISLELLLPAFYLFTDIVVRVMEHFYAVKKKVCVMKDARLVYTSLSVLSFIAYLALFMSTNPQVRSVCATYASAFLALISGQTVHLLYFSTNAQERRKRLPTGVN